MQQHSVPQNVTQYQFRLVGDMTLKQFLELCIGLGLAYLFFASNLIFIIKWPLIILSILFGAGLAFFPIEDRPLDQWIINFVKAIYQPTRFIWEKTNKIPRLFIFEAHAPDIVNSVTKTIKAPVGQSSKTIVSDLSEIESTMVKSLDSLFTSIPAPLTPTSTINHQPLSIDRPTVAVRKLNPQSAVSGVVLHVPPSQSTPIPKSPTPTQPLTKVVFSAPAPSTTTRPSSTMSAPKHISLPASPKFPNLVTGVVVDHESKLVENAIVQIVEDGGIPQRAMKTNSLGQFYTSTPLSPGTYVIEVDKDNLSFAPQQITLNNSIFSPIELRATS